MPEEIDEPGRGLDVPQNAAADGPEDPNASSGDRQGSEGTQQQVTETRLASSSAPRGVIVTRYEHSGPLPDQSWFQAVEQIHAGATELILTDYREQRAHEREMERCWFCRAYRRDSWPRARILWPRKEQTCSG